MNYEEARVLIHEIRGTVNIFSNFLAFIKTKTRDEREFKELTARNLKKLKKQIDQLAGYMKEKERLMRPPKVNSAGSEKLTFTAS